jgi:hypothetical protein
MADDDLGPQSISEYFSSVKGQITDGLKKLEEVINTKSGELMLDVVSYNTQLAGSFGRTQAAVIGLRKEFVSAVPAIAALGGKSQDVFNIIKGTSESLKTNRILLSETTTDLFTAGKALGVSSENMGAVVLDFENAGIQTGLIRDRMQQTANIARVVAANSNAVFSQVQQNLGALNKYGFKDGVEGLSRMAAKAVSLRTDMFEIFNFAEKVFSPEGAIEAVAGFQRMGVAVGDLADPFRLLYLAQEDVEGLYDGILKATEKFSYLDEKTGEVKILSNAKRDLRDIALAANMSPDTLQKNVLAMGKMNKFASEFKFMNVTEEDKLMISNLAEFDKTSKEYKVKVGTETKLISQLSREDIEYLRGRPETVEEIAQAQLTEDELIRANTDSIVKMLGGISAGSKPMGDIQQLIRAGIEGTNIAVVRGGRRLKPAIERVDEGYAKLPKLFKEIADDFKSGNVDVEKWWKKITTASTEYAEELKKLGKEIQSFDLQGEIKKRISKDNLFAQGGGVLLDFTNQSISTLKENFLNPLKESISETQKNLNNFNTTNQTGNANLATNTELATKNLYDFQAILGQINDNFKNFKFEKTASRDIPNPQVSLAQLANTISQLNGEINLLTTTQSNELRPMVNNDQKIEVASIEPPASKQLPIQQNPTMSFSPLNGKIDVRVTREDGGPSVDLTSQVVASAVFQREVLRLIDGKIQQPNYSDIANSTSTSS